MKQMSTDKLRIILFNVQCAFETVSYYSHIAQMPDVTDAKKILTAAP